MADIRKLTEHLSVAPQITEADVAEIAQSEFRSILCNRPDQEEADQPFYAAIQKQAESAGIEIRFQPVNGGNISDADVYDFEQNINDLPQPVLAYCRSGTRCAALWALSQAGDQSADDILKTAAEAGYSLEALRPRIADLE